MSKYYDLGSGDVFPAYWTDAIQEFLGTLVAGLRFVTPTATSVRAAASTGSDQVAIGVAGLFRYRSSNAEVTLSGSAATYNLYIAVVNNDIVGVTDTTDYDWYLYFGLVAPTGAVSAGGTIYATRKVGEVDWDGSQITGLRQTVGSGDATFPTSPTAPTATVTPLAVKGAASQSASLITAGNTTATDRLSLNAAGQLALPVTGGSGGVVIGGDSNLYRSAATTLRSDGSLIVGATITGNALVSTTSVSSATVAATGAITAGTSVSAASASITNAVTAASLTTTGNVTVGAVASAVSATISQNNNTALALSGSSAGMTIGGDTVLYRSAADTLKTDDSLVVAGNAQFGTSSSSTLGFYGTTPATQSTGWTVTNVTTDKAFNANATTVDELADVLGTLITTLKNTGLLA